MRLWPCWETVSLHTPFPLVFVVSGYTDMEKETREEERRRIESRGKGENCFAKKGDDFFEQRGIFFELLLAMNRELTHGFF